jgi:hypothetical protein
VRCFVVDRGRFCYITCPTNNPVVIYEGVYDKEMASLCGGIAREAQLSKAWDDINKCWTLPVKYKDQIINKAKERMDTVYYAENGDYRPLKSLCGES